MIYKIIPKYYFRLFDKKDLTTAQIEYFFFWHHEFGAGKSKYSPDYSKMRNPFDNVLLKSITRPRNINKISVGYLSGKFLFLSNMILEIFQEIKVLSFNKFLVKVYYRKKIFENYSFCYFQDFPLEKLDFEKTTFRILNLDYSDKILSMFEVVDKEEGWLEDILLVRFFKPKYVQEFVDLSLKEGKGRSISLSQVCTKDETINQLDFFSLGIGNWDFYCSERTLETLEKNNIMEEFRIEEPKIKFVL